MGIHIYNRGATSNKEGKDLWGQRLYEVYLNDELVCSFTHFRRDGLAECLHKAAIAVEKEKG